MASGNPKESQSDSRAQQAPSDSDVVRDPMLQAILDTAVEGIITIDECGRIASFNAAAERIFGYTAAEAIGRNVDLLMPVPHQVAHDRSIERYLRTGRPRIIGIGREVQGLRKDGSLFPMELDVSEVRQSGHRLFAGFVRDISARRLAESKLLEREQQLALFIGHAPAAIAMLDLDMRYLAVSRRWHIDYDLPDRPLIGLSHYEFFPGLPERWKESHRRVLAGESVRQEEDICEHADGRIRWMRWEACPWRRSDGVIGGIMIFAEDITERKRLEQEVLEISEREQSRIGQDLHDGLGQHLAAIEFRLLELRQKLTPTAGEHAAAITEVTRLLLQAMEQVRNVAHGLSPVMLEPDGLMHALHALARETEQQHFVSCTFLCPAPVPIQDNVVATHLYRIAQEAIHNALRHGRAKVITIELRRDGQRMIMGVRDNGSGLPPVEAQKTGGMGLRVMRYRAGAAGGSLAVQREAGGGTSVICSLRLPPAGTR